MNRQNSSLPGWLVCGRCGYTQQVHKYPPGSAVCTACVSGERKVPKREPVGIVCPFCKEDDFDKVGLKWHLVGGGNCTEFDETYLLHS